MNIYRLSQNIKDDIKFCKNNKFPFVLFRFPNEDTIKFGLTHYNAEESYDWEMESFDKSEKINEKFYITKTYEPSHLSRLKSALPKYFSDDKNLYMKQIERLKSVIKDKKFKKIVWSRSKSTLTQFDFFQTLIQLHFAFPSCFIYWLYHPKIDEWIGATPELLLICENNSFKTYSLAGTLPKGSKWTSKEKKEQKLVTYYILNALKLKSHSITTNTSTYILGDLQHLLTIVHGKLLSNITEKILLNTLHPTPAICGIPKNETYQFILKNELHDRKFYTGSLSITKKMLSSHYVNLRCANRKCDKTTFFAGGGIVSESEALKEWEETNSKIHSIYQYFVSK